MVSIQISEEALSIATEEALVVGLNLEDLVERALRDHRLRREIK